MCFRNMIARHAQENVQAYMKHFDIHETEAYVASTFSYHGEIPFLYRTFKPTTEPELDLKKERGGYKVVSTSLTLASRLLASLISLQTRHGLFRHPAILEMMLTYYRHIKSDIDTACLSGIHPVGALALVCAAVCSPLTCCNLLQSLMLIRSDMHSRCTKLGYSSLTQPRSPRRIGEKTRRYT